MRYRVKTPKATVLLGPGFDLPTGNFSEFSKTVMTEMRLVILRTVPWKSMSGNGVEYIPVSK